MALIFFVAVVLIIIVFQTVGKKKLIKDNSISSAYIIAVLEEKVSIYSGLNIACKQVFLDRIVYFLSTTRITGEKGADITDEDKVFVAASATIPLIHYDSWAYNNLDEVILYPDYFDERFSMEGTDRNIAGMVGTGALNRKMLLSLPALRRGFSKGGESNTAIHEFVHLIDKADGEVDGIPEYIIPKDLVQPWLKEMHKAIREIREGKSDIDSYAATNEAEFLAVLSEYFFKRPKALKEDHPALYRLLDDMYNRKEE